MTNTKEIIISGHVQGVGFRWATERIAKAMGVKGFVQNLANGDVIIHAQAPNKINAAFIKTIAKGPTVYAKIEHVVVKDIEEAAYHRFQIRH